MEWTRETDGFNPYGGAKGRTGSVSPIFSNARANVFQNLGRDLTIHSRNRRSVRPFRAKNEHYLQDPVTNDAVR